ncbi:biotin ligase C terminal domain protein [Mycobacterium kansasii]|uniref:Biotin ligase C terminal domain protein n=1 Tax=Mycobacterium kansasii TaxID=1768 RepID=A0A1V3WL66_MYCKA|nr:biotin ligase C terminal domain protein [Mycobacterium kansasii]
MIGVGLNVTQDPEEVDGPGATSLFDLGVAAPDRNQLIPGLLRGLAARIAQWHDADALLASDYRARSLTIGSRVRVQLPGGNDVVGVARDIDDRGRLCVETEGEPVLVSAGDVVHLR